MQPLHRRAREGVPALPTIATGFGDRHPDRTYTRRGFSEPLKQNCGAAVRLAAKPVYGGALYGLGN
jgi:hypothetical protein